MSEKEALKKVEIDARKLQIGMYVNMPVSWKAHPFLVNNFRITSLSQIEKIIEAGLKDVVVDVARSKIIDKWPDDQSDRGNDSEDKGRDPNDVRYEAARTAVLEKIKEAVHDKTLPLEDKTKVVYRHSVQMISDVLDKPTTKNIGEAKRAIVGVVDMILAEKETSLYLTRITNHDFYTYTHSVNVGFLAVCLARTVLQDDTHNMHELGAGFFLHDLGKLRIPPEIINKPGRLSEEEMTVIRTHPSRGFKILQEANQLTEECKTIVLQHHERIDGTGYPKQLRSQDIHIYGKICSIADVYDALTSDRPYRQKMRPFDALQLMQKEMMNHFQKELFAKFIVMLT